MKIHHFGIIVSDIKKSLNLFSRLGYIQKTDIQIDHIQNLKIVFIQSSDNTQTLELIESIDDSSSIHHFKSGYHHICFEIDSENFIEEFKKLKIGKIFTKPIQAPALNNREVVFACLNNGLFVEFLL